MLIGNTILSVDEKRGILSHDVAEDKFEGQIISILVLNQDEIIINEKNDWNEVELVLFNALKDTTVNLPVPLRVSPYSIRMKALNDKKILFTDNRRIFFLNTVTPKISGKYSPVIVEIIAGSDTLLNRSSYAMARAIIRNKLNNIDYRNNHLSLVFSTTDYIQGLKKHQYRFINKNSSWSSWQPGNMIKLEGLKAGDYSLEVRVINNHGIVSEPTVLQLYHKTSFVLFMVCLARIFTGRFYFDFHYL